MELNKENIKRKLSTPLPGLDSHLKMAPANRISGTNPAWSASPTLTTSLTVPVIVGASDVPVAIYNTVLAASTLGIAGALTTGQVNIANGATALGTSQTTTAVNILSGAMTVTTGGTRTLNLGNNGTANLTTTINVGTTSTASSITNINIGAATTTTTTILGTFKVGATTIAAGGAVTATLPTAAGTLVGSGDTATVTNTMLAGSIADTKLNQITTASKVSTGALTGNLFTLGSTAIASLGTTTTVAGLVSVTSTTFVGALNGNASTATSVAGGATNQLHYQTGAGVTGFVTAANYGVVTTGATGTPAVTAGAAGVLQGAVAGIPAWTLTPTLTGTNFTGIPNAGLTNSTISGVALGGTLAALSAGAGLAWSVNSTYTGASVSTLAVDSTAAGTPSAWASVTTGTVSIGAGLTTGTLAMAAVGTGATIINIGHTNSITTVTGTFKLGTNTVAVGAGTNTITFPNSSGTVAYAADLSSYATTTYVDNLVQGMSWKDEVVVASTANLAVASAVINGATVDGQVLVTGQRILLKNQSAPAENGIYIVAASGVASRSTDADSATDIAGCSVYVTTGTANGGRRFTLSTAGVITLGTTALNFVVFGSDATYDAVVRKFTQATHASATSVAVTHNLGTRLVTTAVRDNSTFAEVECDVVATDVNTVTFSFVVAPAINAYSFVIHG
jgi:hypothetical protein